MTQAYSDPSREAEPHALPDLEIFELTEFDLAEGEWTDENDEAMEPGWYWWSCFPGCIPDSEPVGPFDTETEALASAQEGGS